MCICLTLSVHQKKWKISVLLLFKSKLIWKLSFDDNSLTKLRRKSEKTLVEWFWRILARVRHADLRRISKPVGWRHMKTASVWQDYCKNLVLYFANDFLFQQGEMVREFADDPTPDSEVGLFWKTFFGN